MKSKTSKTPKTPQHPRVVWSDLTIAEIREIRDQAMRKDEKLFQQAVRALRRRWYDRGTS